MADYWVFRRKGSKRFTFAWAPNPKVPSVRRQATLPANLRTKPEAERYAKEHQKELRDAKPGATRSSSRAPTVAELSEKWAKLRKADDRKAASTVGDNVSHMKNHIVPALGAEHVDELDEPRLRAWIRELRAKVAAFTCRNIVSSLAEFLDDVSGEGWAILRGNVARAKAVRAELPEARPVAERSQKLRLTTKAAQALLDCETVPFERRVRYVLTMTSGLRDGEVSGIAWADIDLDAKTPTARIRQAVQMRTRQGWAKPGKTKTVDSKRLAPLHPAAIAALQEWKLDGWERYVGSKPKVTSPVFPNVSGGWTRPKSAAFLRADLKTAKQENKVDGFPLTFHALRRSFSSWLAEGRVPGPEISRLLGHVPADAAGKHYTEAYLLQAAEYVATVPLAWRVQDASGGQCEEPLPPEEPLSDSGNGRQMSEDEQPKEAAAHTDNGFVNRRSRVQISKVALDSEPNQESSCAAPERVRIRSSTRQHTATEGLTRSLAVLGLVSTAFDDAERMLVGPGLAGKKPRGPKSRKAGGAS